MTGNRVVRSGSGVRQLNHFVLATAARLQPAREAIQLTGKFPHRLDPRELRKNSAWVRSSALAVAAPDFDRPRPARCFELPLFLFTRLQYKPMQ